MKNIVHSYVRKFREERRKSHRAVALLLALALVVSTGVSWQLHATGIALTNETYCGLEEHTHTEDCYEQVLVCGLEESEGHTHTDACYETETTLVCGKEESEGHTHDESCYDEDGNLICGKEESVGHTHTDACYETETVLVCGQEESEGHTHTDSCYETQLTCGKEEHTHTVDCLTDETADVETAADWEATLPILTGEWGTDVAAIAKSQLGYTESTANFTLADDGETRQGYTRYGAWYGNEYGDWDAMFASFCLYYAGVDEDTFPQASGVYAWTVTLNELGLYDEDAEPTNGDLVFFDTDKDGKADHVGVVAGVSDYKVTVIEGDSDDKVQSTAYSLNDSTITGYGVLPEQEVEETVEAEVETETYTATDGGVTVTVTAPVGALPEGAELSVTLFDESSEEYAAAGETVEYDAEDETTGMAAMDISFTVDGVEVEPTEAVTVSIDASDLLPEDADAETIEVQHLTETETGVEATLVADATEDTAGTVDAESVVAEFEVESFSSFTITWYYTNSQSTSITVNIYDTNGNFINSSVETVDTKSFTATNGLSISTLTEAWKVSGYTYAYATVDYTSSSGFQTTSGTVGTSSDSVTTISRSSNTGGGPGSQGGSSSYTITTVSGTQTASGISAINLYYKTNGPTVTVTATMTDTGYLLTATPVDFTSTEDITYTWSIDVSETIATIEDNGDGTATLTWVSGWQESTGDTADAQALTNLVKVSVTGTSTYTNEDGETVTETGSGSVDVSPYYVTVYVYVAAYDDNGNLFSDEMLALLGIDKSTLDGNGYFPAGEIKLDVAFLYGKNYTTQGAALLTSAGDWTDLLAALSEMDTSTLINMTGMTVDNQNYAVDYSLNQGNSVGDYLEMASQDVGYTWGSQHSALFRWNMTTSYGFYDQTVRYHLDLRFSTNTITFKYGNNSLTSDGVTVENRVYITGSTIQEMQESLTIPSGYKFAGFYKDANFTTPWDGVGTPITEDETVYIKLVPIDYVVITYQVAIGEGTVTSPDANNAAVQKGYETFDPDDTTYTVTGSTATADDGYEFAGWYLDEACTQPVNTNWVANGHITPNETWSSTGTYIYYAKFVPATYDITLLKVSSEDSTPLSDASFTLSRTDGETTTYYAYDAETETTSWEEAAAEATTITTGEEGKEVLHSLTSGYTYTLTETAAPDGYNLLSKSITFTVSGGKVSSDSTSDSTVVTVSDDGRTITVTNTPGTVLPSTGGMGTTLYTAAGICMMLAAGGIYVITRKKRNA